MASLNISGREKLEYYLDPGSGLVSVMEFFRHCPQCGRRFHIQLVGKKLTHLDKEEVQTPPRLLPGGGTGLGRGYPYALVEAGVPVTLDIEEFQYAYKCKHCGHEWYEKHTEKHVEKPTID